MIIYFKCFGNNMLVWEFILMWTGFTVAIDTYTNVFVVLFAIPNSCSKLTDPLPKLVLCGDTFLFNPSTVLFKGPASAYPAYSQSHKSLAPHI